MGSPNGNIALINSNYKLNLNLNLKNLSFKIVLAFLLSIGLSLVQVAAVEDFNRKSDDDIFINNSYNNFKNKNIVTNVESSVQKRRLQQPLSTTIQYYQVDFQSTKVQSFDHSISNNNDGIVKKSSDIEEHNENLEASPKLDDKDTEVDLYSEAGEVDKVKPTKDDWYYDPDEPVDKDIDKQHDIWTGDNGDNNDEDDDMGQYGGQKDNVNPDGSNVDDDSNIEGNGDDYDIWEKLDNNENGLQSEDVDTENVGMEDRTKDDFDEDLLEDVVNDDLVKKNKPPNAPSNMVLFYTWMILVVLIMVIGISTYQARCKGFHLTSFHHQAREDRKRLVDHEYA